jgi:hypothetical protein
MSTPPEDVDALFDAAPAAPAAAPAAAPEAAGQQSVFPTAAATGASPDGRKEPRVKVSWPARVQLANGRVVELRVRDLSNSGIGLLTPAAIPANTVLNFAMGVPGLDDIGRITPVSGTIKTTYMVVQGPDIYCGGMWVNLPPAGRDLVDKWIKRLRSK